MLQETVVRQFKKKRNSGPENVDMFSSRLKISHDERERETDSYLLFDNGMQHPMDISCHAFRITTDIKISTLGDQTPNLCCLPINKTTKQGIFIS